MKIAVCVSGVFKCVEKGGIKRYDELRRKKFPEADFYYSTYDQYEEDFKKVFPKENCLYFKEPEMSYHPYIDIPKEKHESPYYEQVTDWIKKGGKKRIDWSFHHSKQILIHTWLADTIKHKYDIIVRTRFDGLIYNGADFSGMLNDTYKNKRANCIAATKRAKYNILRKFPQEGKLNYWCWDQMIIHPSSFVNKQLVDDLHNKKILHCAETGWWQILSKPFGSNHVNWDGWVNHDKNVDKRFLMQKD